jgi:hypothetical protein
MPDDVRTEDAEAEATPSVAHDDIVKRLLDYQRRLRDLEAGVPAPAPSGVPAEDAPGPSGEAAVSDTTPDAPTLVDLTAAEADAETTTSDADLHGSASVPDMSANAAQERAAIRVEELELALERLSSRFATLRSSFQELVLAADEQLATIEDLLREARSR